MKLRQITLSNSLPIVIIEPPSDSLSALLYLIRAGARDENAQTHGLSRFVANMCLKKTANYYTALSLSEELDKIGAFFNLEVDREFTAFSIKAPTDNFDTSLKVLSEVIVSPSFDINELEKEKSFFNTEISNREKDPTSLAFDELFSLFFKNHPLRFSQVGAKSAVKNFKLNTITDYHQRHYNAANSCLVVCTKLEGLENKLEAAFSKLPTGQENHIVPFSYNQVEEQIKTIKSMDPNVYFSIGFPAFERTSEKKVCQILLDILIGKTTSNERLLPVSTNEALADYIRDDLFMFHEIGLFNIQLRTTAKNSKNAYQRVLEELEKVATNAISQDELEKVKGFYKGSLLINLNDHVERAFFYGLQALLEKRVTSIESYFQKIDRVSAQDIQEIASIVFDNSRLHVVMIEPEK